MIIMKIIIDNNNENNSNNKNINNNNLYKFNIKLCIFFLYF